MITLIINGKKHRLDVDENMPLLWALRDVAGYTGTKFGCGKGFCGACSIHLDDDIVRSCITPVGAAKDRAITTIEGLSRDDQLHPVQQAWVDLDVPQCGYCQSGQIMAAAALLKKNPDPTDEEIRAGMPNYCRCGTYLRIFAAVKKAAGRKGGAA